MLDTFKRTTTVAMTMQLDVALWEQDWRWHCERSFTLTLGDGVVDLFFIDTNPGIKDYQTAVFANNTGKQATAVHQASSSGAVKSVKIWVELHMPSLLDL